MDSRSDERFFPVRTPVLGQSIMRREYDPEDLEPGEVLLIEMRTTQIEGNTRRELIFDIHRSAAYPLRHSIVADPPKTHDLSEFLPEWAGDVLITAIEPTACKTQHRWRVTVMACGLLAETI